MTNKHFIAIAESLRLLRKALNDASADGCDNSIDLALNEHVSRIMEICGKSNPNFKRSTFLDATI